MGKNDITIKGQLHDYIDFAVLLRTGANELTYKCEVKKYKVIASQKIGGLSKGAPKILKLTNKSHNYKNFKEVK